MIHFAYPNVKLSQKQFIGCGRYAAAEHPPDQTYEPASPRITRIITKVKMAAAILAPEPCDIRRDIFEIKDRIHEKYMGESQALAYLLALISRSRTLRPGISGDIWCTGGIDIADGKNPILDAVDPEGFNIKLNAFIFEQESDLLFAVPETIVQLNHYDLMKENGVSAIDMNRTSEISVSDIAGQKTVLLVHPFKLDDLINLLFEPPEPAEPVIGANPYKGLEAFQESDADRFFGRERLTQEIWEKFQALQDAPVSGPAPLRFLTILGPSGSGKSSVARAGLIPLLKNHGYRTAVFTPGAYPLEALAGALARIVTDDPAPAAKTREFAGEMRHSNPKGEWDGLRRIAGMLPRGSSAGLVLLADQFEEIYALCDNADERVQFAGNLLCAAADRSARVSVILTLRSDFLGQTHSYPDLNHAVAQQSVIAPAMTREELWVAIAEPARLAGRPLDAATVSLLITETEGREGALPLLEFALTRIWEGLADGAEPAETLKAIGGVGGALAGAAQHLFDRLSDPDKRIARRAFLALVRLGEGAKDTRRRAAVSELIGHQEDPAHVKKIIGEFSKPGARLITLASDAQGKEIAEVTHEALFEHWTTLKEWLDESREDIRFHRRLAEASAHWQARNKPDGLLVAVSGLGRSETVSCTGIG